MKKVISVATTAAMTLSMLSVPAIIASAAETTPVSFAVEDVTVSRGITEFTVPVKLTKAATVTAAEFDLSTKMFYGGTYSSKIAEVTTDVAGLAVSYKDGKATVTGSADVKKTDAVIKVKVQIFDNKGEKATQIPANALFTLNVDKATVNGAAASTATAEDANAFLFVKAEEATAGAKVTVGSECTTKKTVKVPVTISGAYGAINTRFRVSNGAVIKSVEILDDDFTPSTDGLGIVYAPTAVGTTLEDKVLDNAVVANLEIELPESAVSGQSFKVTTKFFDASTNKKTPVSPEAIEAGDIIYVMKGDTNLSNTIEQVDATYLLRESLSIDVSKTTTLPKFWEKDGVLANNEEVANTVDTLGMDKLVDAVRIAIDADENSKITVVDGTQLLKFILARSVTPDKVTTYDAYLAEVYKK